MSAGHNIKDDLIQEQILQAAQQLFQQYGLHKVTMDEVAKAIGKGRSSLYYYYKSKDEIFDAVMDAEMKEILTEIAQAVDQAPDMEQKINAYCTTRLKITQKRRMFYNIIENGMNADELSDYRKLRNTRHQRFRQLEIPLLRGILNFGIAKGQIRAMGQKEQDALIFVLLSTLQGFKREMLLKKSFHSIDPGITMLTNLVIQGFKK